VPSLLLPSIPSTATAILIAPFLSVETGLAADVVGDDPCLTCPFEANSSAVLAANPEMMAVRRNAPANIAKERGAEFYFLDHELALFGPDARGLDGCTETPCGPWTPGMGC
jgi:hypothetical protein